jgi:urea transporter
MLFFSKNRLFSILILSVSFFSPSIGYAGLLSVVFSVITGYLLGFDSFQLKTGLYSYSALLFGLGFANNFEIGLAFYLLLLIGAILSTLLSVAIAAKLYSKNIPGLSLAFIFTTWVLILASKQFAGIGLTQSHIYWVNETYAIGGNSLLNFIQKFENLEIFPIVAGFFKSLSAIIFQANILTGIILFIGLFIESRISFFLIILGYVIAIIFSQLMGGFNSGVLSYYNMGTNFMLVSLALGGFYLIPSWRSVLWLFITVPITYLFVFGLGTFTNSFGLPVFSMPFCITVILFLYCLQLRKNIGKLVITPLQFYNPEINLYRFINSNERIHQLSQIQFGLPFMGEWMVSQGYEGSFTHKGDWSKAIDFVVLDHEMKNFKNPGSNLEHFYCYNKPVIAPADGVIEEIIDFIDDNNIGEKNVNQNWGNTIIIKHSSYLYSKLSHLKKQSFKFQKGDFVKKGDIIAQCGNSGRSPEPHLHFQIQSTPYVGSKTITYPIAHFYCRADSNIELKHFSVPKEGTFVSNVQVNSQLQQAFKFETGLIYEIKSKTNVVEVWEVITDQYNNTYFYCEEKNASAYFINDGTVFYFTNYIGPKNSLLFYFYLSAYKVVLTTEMKTIVEDQFPISTLRQNVIIYLQDILAPFFIFIKLTFKIIIPKIEVNLSEEKIILNSQQIHQLGLSKKSISTSEIIIQNKCIQSFTINIQNKNIQLSCKVKS